MKKIQTNQKFYIELSPEEIKICTPLACSCYPIWLGKNRAIIRDVVAYFEKNPPKTLIECLHIIGHFELNGHGSHEKPVKELFEKDAKDLDNEKTFW